MARQKQPVAIVGRQGFTLLEMTVVIAIVAVVLTFGLDIGRTALRGAERLSTQEKLVVIQKALDAYAERNGYLPCPADPALIPSDTAFGLERRSTTAGAGCLTGGGITLNSSVYFGTVPVRNLGLNDGFASDAWGNKLLYALSSQHMGGTGTGINSYYANAGTIEIRSGTRAAPIVLTTQPSGDTGPSATYAVISHGSDGRGAIELNSTVAAIACGTDTTLIEVENCDRSNAVFFDNALNDGTQASTRFNDYVVWGTNLLKRNPAAVLTNSCPAGCEPWCATCETTGTSTPPGTGTRVCQKIITTTTPCRALCIWPSATTPCP